MDRLIWIKGRGARHNQPSRFDTTLREAADDGWQADTQSEDAHYAPPVRTEVQFEQAKTILSRNESPDIPFEHGLNPYRGCEHGCIYCYARPTHSYLGLSPGLDFETKLIVKQNAAQLLADHFDRPGYRPQMIGVGTVTDPYQPIEREYRITRQVLEVFASYQHPYSVITKNALIERDLDLLSIMGPKRLASAHITLTSLDLEVSRALEPRACSPQRRLQAVQRLTDAGVPVGVSVAPIIPFLTDDQIEHILEAAWAAGARTAFYAVLRLPWEVAPLFQDWLQVHFPLRAERVMARVRDMRSGRDNDPRAGVRMTGEGIWADLIAQRFWRTAKKLGFNKEQAEMDYSLFKRPKDAAQGSLF